MCVYLWAQIQVLENKLDDDEEDDKEQRQGRGVVMMRAWYVNYFQWTYSQSGSVRRDLFEKTHQTRSGTWYIRRMQCTIVPCMSVYIQSHMKMWWRVQSWIMIYN